MSREQLTQLARPFPAKYVKKPAPGKYGTYVDHEIVTQALLFIVGPFSFQVQQVFYNPDGILDGCTAALTCTIDGREVTITEAGDCENPTNSKTQGDRLKKAASDALKRCAMRLGLGIHLWAGSEGDFFLFDSLVKSSTADSSREHPAADAGGAGSPAAPPTSKARVQQLVSRCVALRADHVDVDQAQADWNLPDLAKCDDKQLDLWGEMLTDEEKTLAAPFVEPEIFGPGELRSKASA